MKNIGKRCGYAQSMYESERVKSGKMIRCEAPTEFHNNTQRPGTSVKEQLYHIEPSLSNSPNP